MVDQLQLVGEPQLDGKLVEGHIQKEKARLDQGVVGKLIGSNTGIPWNVAALIALGSSGVMIFAVVLWAGAPDFGYKDAVAALSSLVTLTVGYLFGRSSKE